MPEDNTCLGLCFFNNQLFYAVGSSEDEAYLRHIGAVNFNFNLAQALFSDETEKIEGLRSSVRDLIDRFDVHDLSILLHPRSECWATLPKRVYDDADEREAYINILMNGMKRKHIHSAWHSLSNQNYRLLRLRTDHAMRGLERLTVGMGSIGFSSAFEVGESWIGHARPGGSFLTIGRFNNCISISSYMLGKLRGATYLMFDDLEDLPYLWLRSAEDLTWLQGLHEQIQVYGYQAHSIIEVLQSFWDDEGAVVKMDTLEKMQVRAEETTYGFDLALAYPAIMLALE
jgi:hypothetical protein